MYHHNVIDRQIETAILEQLCELNSTKRILFVEASTGFGKTALIDKFWATLEAKNLPRASISLSPHVIDECQILHRITEAWGIDHFGSFRCILDGGPPSESISIHKNIVVGLGKARPGIQVSILGDKVWGTYVRRLTEAWFSDIANIPSKTVPHLLLIDDYNSSTSDQGGAGSISSVLERWIELEFLPKAAKVPHLRVIVSGRKTPRIGHDTETYVIRRSLGPIHDVTDWMQFVRGTRGSELPYEAVKAMCLEHKGYPLDLATALVLLCEFWAD